MDTIIVIVILVLYHFLAINVLEKIAVRELFGANDITRRPLPECKSSDTFLCMGMPSGHVEVTTIAVLSLMRVGILTPEISAIIIGLMGIQRVVSHMHTITQVIIGGILGIAYFCLYNECEFSWKSLLIPIIISITLCIIICTIDDATI